MYNGRINRRTSAPDQNQPHKEDIPSKGKENAENPQRGYSLSKTYHIAVIYLHSDKTADKPARCYPPVSYTHLDVYKRQVEKLPNHFHDYYELGYIASGSRRVICQSKEYIGEKNDLLLFNPNDNHAFLELKKELLDFRCVHLTAARMQELMVECLGFDAVSYTHLL